ncbi:MAG: glycoside hydrolase 43 family protein [Candidatus Marinimicrobia bacterium]|nr:glycoside hydrolase 43 family protein [Candidatus Neomarinimicrobiota bacterium]|tara:strand:+ start:6375 stop:8066 length:1692 start_codon:yes stop_codon:yes gene_type:complete
MKRFLYKIIVFSGIVFCKEGYFINPIITGAHPDPSICRVGGDYYIVNSSFEFFPGLPIHHSKDLVNWELIGYGLHREDQCNGRMNLVDVQSDGGIHAPTIRYHKGTFYIITTNVYNRGDGSSALMRNFIITAKNASGPWSKPHIIEGAPGIDPDIFFDDNGKVYFTGTHHPGDMNKNGIGEIWVQELDIKDWKLVGERYTVWDGVFGCCTEGPHIYKENGLYYLMVAEGGTGKNHAVMIAASEKIIGPYEENPRNPILTSRHLTDQYFVNSTGHADLIELPDGRWYMVALGKRNDLNGDSNMGRETYLIPVSWEPAIVKWEQVSETKWEPVKYLWPVAAPKTGKVERYTPLPFPKKIQYRNDVFIDDFDLQELNLEWNFVRVPQNGTFSISQNPGYFRLYAKSNIIENHKQFSFTGFRQKETDFEYAVKMDFSPTDEEIECGIIHYQKEYNYLSSTIYKDNRNFYLSLKLEEKHKDLNLLKKIRLKNYKGEIIFKVISKNNEYSFSYSLDNGNSFESLHTAKAEVILDRNYTGAYLGLYATSNGKKSSEYADFDWVKYKGFAR